MRFIVLVATFISACSSVEQYKTLLVDDDPPLPDAVTMTWLGTAGLFISDGRTRILLDPYVTRRTVDPVSILTGLTIHSNEDAVKKWVDDLDAASSDAIIVSHAHFDHVLDVPNFARHTQATVYGSKAVAEIAKAASTPFPTVTVHHRKCVKIGETFRVLFLESDHGKPFFGRSFAPGPLKKVPVQLPMNAYGYRLGETFSVLIEHASGSIVYNASAGWQPETFDDVEADIAVMALAGRQDSADYVQAVAGKTGARRIIPVHFDYFLGELSPEVRMFPGVKFSEFVAVARQQIERVSIETLPIGEARTIFPPARGPLKMSCPKR